MMYEAMQCWCRNTEVQHAVDELVRLVDTFPRENMEAVDAEDISMFKQHHSKLMYKVRSDLTTAALVSKQWNPHCRSAHHTAEMPSNKCSLAPSIIRRSALEGPAGCMKIQRRILTLHGFWFVRSLHGELEEILEWLLGKAPEFFQMNSRRLHWNMCCCK